jgi:glycosyltransferase involved in cell wall biosynthesis
MQRAGLVVVPYLEATQSAVIATAYAFARPVIASDVGGLREMVIQGKTGLLVPPNDSSALAKAIETLARDGRRLSRMGRHARALAEKTWAWDKIAAQHISLYRGVLSRRGG